MKIVIFKLYFNGMKPTLQVSNINIKFFFYGIALSIDTEMRQSLGRFLC